MCEINANVYRRILNEHIHGSDSILLPSQYPTDGNAELYIVLKWFVSDQMCHNLLCNVLAVYDFIVFYFYAYTSVKQWETIFTGPTYMLLLAFMIILYVYRSFIPNEITFN